MMFCETSNLVNKVLMCQSLIYPIRNINNCWGIYKYIIICIIRYAVKISRACWIDNYVRVFNNYINYKQENGDGDKQSYFVH